MAKETVDVGKNSNEGEAFRGYNSGKVILILVVFLSCSIDTTALLFAKLNYKKL